MPDHFSRYTRRLLKGSGTDEVSVAPNHEWPTTLFIGTEEEQILFIGTEEEKILFIGTEEEKIFFIGTEEEKILFIGTEEEKILSIIESKFYTCIPRTRKISNTTNAIDLMIWI